MKKRKNFIFGMTAIFIILIIIVAVFVLKHIGGNITKNHNEDDITKYEWAALLSDYTGIISYVNKEPYFEDVTAENEYFALIQSLVEWDYISHDKKFNGDEIATGRFIALSAMKSVGKVKLQIYLNTDNEISDEEYLQLAIDSGLIQDKDLKRGFSKEEAKEIIKKLDKLYFSEFWQTGIENVVYQEDVIELEDKDVIVYNDDLEEIVVSDELNQKLSVGDVIVFYNKGFVTARKIQSVAADHQTYVLEIPGIEEVLDTLIESDVKELGFQDIVNYYGEENLIAADKPSVTAVSHTFSGKVQNAGFMIEAVENSDHKLEIFVTDNNTGMRYQLPVSKQISDDWGNLNVKFNVESIFVGSQIKYSVSSGIEYVDIAVDIQSEFSGGIAGEAEEKILLFETPTPLGSGIVGVDIGIYLVASLEGEISLKVELPFQNTVHYEKGKGIRNIKRDIGIANPEIKASGEMDLKARIAPVLIICEIVPVLDVELDMGVASRADITVRDTKQVCTNVEIAFPVIDISVGDEDILYHGSKTLLAMLGVTGNWEIIAFEDAPKRFALHHEMLPGGTQQFVEQCTYKKELAKEEEESFSGDINTYTTKYGSTYEGTIPTFQFDYPSDWIIAVEYVDETSEYVELSNDAGAVIRFQYIVPAYAYGNSRVTEEILVEKVVDLQLVLERQSLDGPVSESAEKLVVAKIYSKSMTQHFPGVDRPDEIYSNNAQNDSYVYAVKWESDCGTHYVDANFTYALEYSGLLSFEAQLPEAVTEDEERVVVDILSSLRMRNDGVSKQEDSNVTVDDPIYSALVEGDYSYFSGTYKALESYNDAYGGGQDLDNLVLQEDGIIIGGGMWFFPDIYPDIKPMSVLKQEDGSYRCQVTYNSETDQNYFVIYPEGVIQQNPYIYNASTFSKNVYIQYMQLDGGVADIVYYKVED